MNTCSRFEHPILHFCFPKILFYTILLLQIVQCRPSNLQYLCGFRMISFCEFQCSNDTFPFRIHISQRRRPRRSPRKRIKLQVFFRNLLLFRHDHGIFDDPFQFSHITWPGIHFQSFDGSGTETIYFFSEPQFISPQKEFCQGFDIFYRLSQWR